MNHPLLRAIALVGQRKLAHRLGLTHQAVRKWVRAGRMPRTEWTGETSYSDTITELTDHAVTKDQLLGAWPKHDSTVEPVSPFFFNVRG